MSKLTFAERAWEKYLYWQENDKKNLGGDVLPQRDLNYSWWKFS
jgi:hypothetical protein